MIEKKILGKIQSMQMLDTLLPYRFDDNSATINGLEVKCSGCKTAISADSIKAEITFKNAHSAAIDAYAMCDTCKLVTPVFARFSSAGDLLQNTSQGWIAGRWIAAPKVGLFAQLKSIMGI